MTERPSPAAQALLDQADVAGRDGAAILTALAGQLDAAITDVAPNGPLTELLRGFVRRYLSGGVGCCPHLGRSAVPSWWLPAKPGRLRCLTCTQNAASLTPRHRERCDHCGRVRNPLRAGVVLLPPVVLEDLVAGSAVAVGPVAVLHQFCSGCEAVTDSTPSVDGSGTS
jgi:hypothetical protein